MGRGLALGECADEVFGRVEQGADERHAHPVKVGHSLKHEIRPHT